MKKLKDFLCAVYFFGFLIVGLVFIYATNERDPHYRPYVTTFMGQDAMGQLHRDGSYSFYRVRHKVDNVVFWDVTDFICNLPAAEAVKLH